MFGTMMKAWSRTRWRRWPWLLLPMGLTYLLLGAFVLRIPDDAGKTRFTIGVLSVALVISLGLYLREKGKNVDQEPIGGPSDGA